MRSLGFSLPATPLVLLAVCAALGGVLYIELSQPPIETAGTAGNQPTGQPPAPREAGRSLPPLNTYAEVVQRPLFAETRRPAVQQGPAQQGPPQSLDVTLVGIIISDNDRHALVEHGQPQHLERITEGQDLDGWTVESILADRIVLTRGDTRVEVKPKDVPGAPAPVIQVQPRRPAENATGNPLIGSFPGQPGFALTGGQTAQTGPRARIRQ